MRQEGARAHPNSGAGPIKFDGSNDEAVIEVKDANASFQLKGKYIADLHRIASRRKLKALLIVRFTNGYEARIEVKRSQLR